MRTLVAGVKVGLVALAVIFAVALLWAKWGPRSSGSSALPREVDRVPVMPPRKAPTSTSPIKLDDDAFWSVIDQARSSPDPEQQLRRILLACSPESVLEFAKAFDATMNRAYTQELWGAGYLVEGGMSDDAFEYFRVWLIMQGRTTFEQVLSHPDSLADFVDDRGFYEMEGPQYVAPQIYAAKTDGNWPDQEPEPELGEGWDFDDKVEMAHRYPRLSAKF
jgi:hypothetical protein